MNLTTKLSPRRAVAGGALVLAATAGALALSDLGSAADPERPPPTAPAAPTDPALSDGRHFGWLRAAYVAPDEVVFDVAELIPGDTEDGAYTIRDTDGGNLTLPVDDGVVVTVVTCEAACNEGASLDYGALTRAVRDGDAYWLTVEDGLVVGIDQQYLP